jgi:hypothetical protein
LQPISLPQPTISQDASAQPQEGVPQEGESQVSSAQPQEGMPQEGESQVSSAQPQEGMPGKLLRQPDEVIPTAVTRISTRVFENIWLCMQ